jgi:hypothetical protein
MDGVLFPGSICLANSVKIASSIKAKWFLSGLHNGRVLEAKVVSATNAPTISGLVELGLIASIARPVILEFLFEFCGVQNPWSA